MTANDVRSTITAADLLAFGEVSEQMAEYAETVHDRLRQDGNCPFESKKDGSRLSIFDTEIEKGWREIAGRKFPTHSVIGEEFGGSTGRDGYCWYLDPIDGTDDLTRGIPLYGFIVALELNGLPVCGTVGHPALGLRVSAMYGHGTRVNGVQVRALNRQPTQDVVIAIPALADFLRGGDNSRLFLSIARLFPNHRIYRNVFAHTQVVTGALAAAIEYGVNRWDVAATRILVEEAGGKYVEFGEGEKRAGHRTVNVVFGEATVVQSILSAIQEF